MNNLDQIEQIEGHKTNHPDGYWRQDGEGNFYECGTCRKLIPVSTEVMYRYDELKAMPKSQIDQIEINIGGWFCCFHARHRTECIAIFQTESAAWDWIRTTPHPNEREWQVLQCRKVEHVKPPIGVYPRKFWLEDRRKALFEAMERQRDTTNDFEIINQYHSEINEINSELEKFVGLEKISDDLTLQA